MEKIGFWESLFSDVGPLERERLNDAALELASVGEHQNLHWQQLQKLFALDRAQSKEITRLRCIVRVLSEILVDNGIVDRTLLAERMDVAIREIELQENAQGSPYRGGPGGQLEPMATCIGCQESVRLRLTNLTADGTVCDKCFGGWPGTEPTGGF